MYWCSHFLRKEKCKKQKITNDFALGLVLTTLQWSGVSYFSIAVFPHYATFQTPMFIKLRQAMHEQLFMVHRPMNKIFHKQEHMSTSLGKHRSPDKRVQPCVWWYMETNQRTASASHGANQITNLASDVPASKASQASILVDLLQSKSTDCTQ